MELIHQDLTERLLNAAVTVHRKLGPGFLESIHEADLCHERSKRAHRVERQQTLAIVYDGVVVGEHRLGLLVDRAVVIELKDYKPIENIHLATARSYLKATGCRVALVLNFAEAKLGVRRIGL